MAFKKGNEFNVPGSYELKKLRLEGTYGTIDLDYLFLELSIFEDIFGNTIFGKLTLNEGFNILGNMPVIEGDILKVRCEINHEDPIMIKMDDERPFLDIEFEVIRVAERMTPSKDVNAYTLSLATTGWSDDHYRRVSRSLHKQKYSDMVQSVFDEEFQTGSLIDKIRKKKIEIEPTDGEYSIIFPNWHPLKCFNFLASKSTDGNNVSDWLFYEDIESFKFVSMNSLLKKETMKRPHYTQMSNVTEGNGSLNENIYMNFDDISYIDSGNLLNAAERGLLSNDLLIYDLHNRKAIEYWDGSSPEAPNYKIEKSFRYNENFESKSHCDRMCVHLTLDPIVDKFVDHGGSKKTFQCEHPKMWDDQPDGYEIHKYSRQRASQREAINYFKISASGPGLFSRKIGDKIELKLASPQWAGDGKQDERLQGNYLITALKRTFTTTEHTMVLELSKDNYFDGKPDHIWDRAIEKNVHKIADRDAMNDGGNY